jgi:hypothetical protein
MRVSFKAMWEFSRDYAKGVPLDWLIWTKSGHAVAVFIVGGIVSKIASIFTSGPLSHDLEIAFVTLFSVAGLLVVVEMILAFGRQRALPASNADQPHFRDFVSSVRISDDGIHLPSLHFTTGNQPARKIPVSRKIKKLRFVLPREQVISDPPADIPIGKGRVIIKQFVPDGILLEEQNTYGDILQAEIYFDDHDESVIRKPAIVYENFDERIFKWPKVGEPWNYVHLFFRNEETGGIARNPAVKLSWWDIRNTGRQPLFSVDGKRYDESPERAQAEDLIDFLPNKRSHGFDLFVRKPGEDWIYGLDNSFQPIIERHRLHLGIYKVRITISCEGYSQNFWFRVITGPNISVREYVSPEGDETLGLKDEFWR